MKPLGLYGEALLSHSGVGSLCRPIEAMTSTTAIPKTMPTTSLYVFLQFVYLQGLDLLSTVAFLMSGVSEANPVVRFAMRSAGNPIIGLVYVKACALALCLICLGRGHLRLLQRVNLFFALLVAWNLISLILGQLLRAQ